MTNLIKKVENAVIRASTTYHKDRISAFKLAYEKETNENAIWALDLMLKNMEIANKNKLALCDDTGIPHVFIEIGKESNGINGEFIEDIKKGIDNGLKNLPARPMAVKGNDIERIEQSKGLFSKPEKLAPPSFIIDSCEGEDIFIHILLLGGGPEIRSKTYRVFHKRDHNNIFNDTIEWLKKSLPLLGCTPTIPAIGIGRTHYEANSLLIKSLALGNLDKQTTLENRLTCEVNKFNIGPMGLGGDTTALGSFINIGPQRASGVRISAIRPCCFVDPRVSSFKL
ncbi:fumarate hydratase [Methanobrevibacter filiformis]|uniref:Fumarate hydratase n=1 Tax=Methanobrevibacter filiformis TaxID=55758 RepID=A0A165Z123_9EURY|nr:fumarate hydratase [Methanobrevibacter filiformis]KZX10113.1 fumarate hydratase [Methanobrevibacter filiformis]